jgi:hypothetical protein
MAWGRTGACVPRQKVDKISLFSLSTCGSTRKFTRHPVTAQRVGLPWRRIQHVLFRALQTRGLGNSIVLTTRRLSKATRTSATRHVDVVNKYQGKENSFTYSRKLFLHCLFTTNTWKDRKLSRGWSPHTLTCLSCMYKFHRCHDSHLTSRYD